MSELSEIRRALASGLAERIAAPEGRVSCYRGPSKYLGGDGMERFMVRVIAGPEGNAEAEAMLDRLMEDEGEVSVRAHLDELLEEIPEVSSGVVKEHAGWQSFPPESARMLGSTWTVDLLPEGA